MGEKDATVLVAMPPSERRQLIVEAVSAHGHDVRTADDGVRAVDRIRHADVVLVGDYPTRVVDVVLAATTPPGVVRPNVLLADDTDALEAVPDERLSTSATAPAVADAVEGAVSRADYTRRVAAFSEAAAEAATNGDSSHALARRVAGLARDARAVQTDFSPTDWTAAFRSVTRPDAPRPASKSGNRTS
ncbi:hypothetical protein [Halorubellus sp. PRR65]|uniref:hypothetical protein n=1 Tax=Halorubellus sp. PRR65 TaxID=3098148 RepID=UPI002B258A79|nr:hypothetical protein [Halorubellus sp. PRR65]